MSSHCLSNAMYSIGQNINHGLCGSNKLLYKRCAFSMGDGKFRPNTAPIFFIRSFWNSKLRNISETWTRLQNLVKIGSPGASERTPKFWPYILGYPFLFIFYFLYSSLSVPIAPRVVLYYRQNMLAVWKCYCYSDRVLQFLCNVTNEHIQAVELHMMSLLDAGQ